MKEDKSSPIRLVFPPSPSTPPRTPGRVRINNWRAVALFCSLASLTVGHPASPPPPWGNSETGSCFSGAIPQGQLICHCSLLSTISHTFVPGSLLIPFCPCNPLLVTRNEQCTPRHTRTSCSGASGTTGRLPPLPLAHQEVEERGGDSCCS